MESGNLAEWVQAAGIFAAVGTWIWQKRSHDLQAVLFVLEQMGSREMRDLRHWVLNEMKWKSAKDMTGIENERWRTVAVSLDRVGFLARIGCLPPEVFKRFVRPELFRRLWTQLKPLIQEVRSPPQSGRSPAANPGEVSGSHSGYCDNFEWLVKKHLPQIERGRSGYRMAVEAMRGED